MNWLLVLQQAGLPVISAELNPFGKVDAAFSRELTPAEWLLFLSLTDPNAHRKANAAKTAKAIPQWATWTQVEWAAYFTANLSDLEADKVTSIALARVAIKRQNAVINALAQMVIAMRDEVWPDLPDK